MAPKAKSWFVRQKVLGANIHETEGLLERNIAFGKGDAVIFVLALLTKSTGVLFMGPHTVKLATLHKNRYNTGEYVLSYTRHTQEHVLLLIDTRIRIIQENTYCHTLATIRILVYASAIRDVSCVYATDGGDRTLK